MPLLPTYTEQLYSPLPPADLLRRLADRTALVHHATPALGGQTSRTRYLLMHLFEGIITDQQFTIRRLVRQGAGWNWSWSIGDASQNTPGLEGWVAATATGGTQLQLCYQQPAAAWGLLLVPAGALFKFTSEGDFLLLALVKAASISTLAWLLAWGAFRYEVAQWRGTMAELLHLQTSAPA
jgi:hypothetical protein